MNPISKALDEIKFRIPPEILNLVFLQQVYQFRRAPVSLDEQMMTLVIRPRVLFDCNLVGGMMVIVPLDGINPEYIDNYSLVYKIPDERLLNRTLVSVLSIGYMPYSNAFNSMGTSYGNIAPTSINDTMSTGQRLADSYASIPPISNAVVDIIGHNTVVIRDQFRVSAAYQLRCIVGNDENLNNLNPRSYLAFSKLCELAIKSYVYRTMLIRIDQGYLQGGQELGIVKTFIEGLSDAEENYQTFLNEKWRKVALMNDVPQYDRLVKLMINPAV
jgi:hypothetical protein